MLYKKIQNVIREQIDCGSLKPGDVVASERDLAKRHGVSQMTARQALVGLAMEGLVERHPGCHTVVAMPRREAAAPTGPSTSYVSVVPTTTSAARRLRDARPYFATRFPLSPSQEVNTWRCEVMQRLRGRRVGIETVYFFRPPFSHTGSDPELIFRLLRSQTDAEALYYDEQIGVTSSNARACTLLGLMPGNALLQRRQIGYSRCRRVVCCVSGLYLPAHFQVSIRRSAAIESHCVPEQRPTGTVSLLENLGRFDQRVAAAFSDEFQPWTLDGFPTYPRYD